MSSTADSPAPDVHRPTSSFQIANDYVTEEEHADQDNENDKKRQHNGDALPKIDLLGLGNEEEKKNVTARVKSKSDLVPGIGDDDQHGVIYNFPPGISTLNVNGRPKFEVVTVREEGRLQMFMVPKVSPQLVRSPGRNGRLKMWLLNDDQRAGALPPVRRSI